MTVSVELKRRINGAAGSPPSAGAKEGEIAFNAPGAPGSTTKPTMFFFDGTAWRTVNPDVTVSTQSIVLGAAANIGQAYTNWAGLPGNSITGNVVIATFGTPAQAYVLTNAGSPGVSASWTSLGGATMFATQADVNTGTDTTGAVNPATLRGTTVNASSGAASADKIVRLGANGRIDSSMLAITGVNIQGTADPTAPAAAGPVKGDLYFASKAGALDTSYVGAAGTAVKTGDSLLYDGAAWHVVANETDLSAYVPLAGTNLMTGNIVWSGAAGAKAGTTIIDGKGGTVDNVNLDCGTY